MKNINFFGVYDENQVVYSSYIPLISFSSQEQKESAELYILSEADDLFRNILMINVTVEPIPYSKTISFQDFTKVDMEYFYTTLFFDLCDRDSNGKLIKKLKWSVVFDEESTPIQVAYLSPSFFGDREEARLVYSDRREGRPYLTYRPNNPYLPYRKYGFISLNGEPIFYYLYFTLQEILDAIK